MTPDNIFAELRLEHDRHRGLLQQISETSGDSKERRSLFAEFMADAEAHAAAEELVFYSRLMAEATSRDMAAHSIEEHQSMRDALEAVRECDMSSSGWLQRFAAAREKFEHHMKEEEHGVFQLAGKVLAEREKRDLVTEFRKAKRGELVRRKESD